MRHWAFNPLDPNHGPAPRSQRDSGYRVVEAWPTLPPAIREAILAMLRADE